MKKRRKTLLISVGILMIGGGLFLLSYGFLRVGKFPYTYILVERGKPLQFPQFSQVKAYGGRDPTIKKYELRLTEDHSLLSTFFTFEDHGRPPVIIGYKTNGFPPLLTPPVRHETFQGLYKEIMDHTTEDSVFVSWWDHSLRINLFTGRPVLFREYFGEPIFIPEAWQGWQGAISEFEKRFWGIKVSREGKETFERFLEAMLSPEEKASVIFKQLAGNRPTYVVVEQDDILKLSESAGERFRVIFEDFEFTGNMHGLIKRIKNRLKEKRLEDYAVEQIDKDIVRVYYLTRPEDREKLMVRLLPFTSSNPFRLAHFKLRFQKETIWVYELS